MFAQLFTDVIVSRIVKHFINYCSRSEVCVPLLQNSFSMIFFIFSRLPEILSVSFPNIVANKQKYSKWWSLHLLKKKVKAKWSLNLNGHRHLKVEDQKKIFQVKTFSNRSSRQLHIRPHICILCQYHLLKLILFVFSGQHLLKIYIKLYLKEYMYFLYMCV